MAKWTEQQKLEAKKRYAERIKQANAEETESEKEQDEVVASTEVTPALTKFDKTDDSPEPDFNNRPMGMDYEHKIQSMSNAVKILPPNMIKEGRHLKENIQAICGFMVTDEMMDEVYKDYVHPEY